MNIRNLVDVIEAGGPGSGCHGPKCGRPPNSLKTLSQKAFKQGKTLPDLADEVEDWTYDDKTAIGRAGWFMRRTMVFELRNGTESEVKAWNVKGETLAVAFLNVHKENMEVRGLLANPKYLGSKEMREVLTDIKKYAKEQGIKNITFSRLKIRKDWKRHISEDHSVAAAGVSFESTMEWWLGLS